MKRSAFYLSVIVLLLAALPAVWSHASYRNAKAARVTSEARVERIHALASEKQQLESNASLVGLEARRTDELQAPLVELVTDLKLPRSAFKSVQEVASNKLSADSPLQRQDVTVGLTGLSLSDLGALLSLWRTRQPSWTVTSIDLLHSTRRTATPTVYDIKLTISSIYLREDQSK